MLIYFAGPLFCEAERAHNQRLTTKLEDMGFSVFLPQRDGIELDQELQKGPSERELCKKIFNIDRNKLLQADIFLMVMDGRVPDEGACLELGMAHENKLQSEKEKLLIGLQTDMRVFAKIFRLNAMVMGALDSLVDNENALMTEIQAFRNREQSIKS